MRGFTEEPNTKKAILEELRYRIRETETEDKDLWNFAQLKERKANAVSSNTITDLSSRDSQFSSGYFQQAILKWITPGKVQEELAWVAYKNDRAFLVKEVLQEKVALANNILLLIPDTKTSLQKLAQAFQPLVDAKHYDLVLLFDYSPIGTRIEESARLLAARIKEAGLAKGAKNIVMLGDQLSGLVARWYVECEGGNQVISRLILVGTPISGINNGILRVSRLVSVFSRIIPIGIPIFQTTESPKKEGSLLYQLNQTPDPGIPYILIVGNTSLLEGKDRPKFYARWNGALNSGFTENDGFLSVKDLKAVPGNRKAEIMEVGVDFSHYYQKPESLQAIYRALGSSISPPGSP